jgi:hypothetical protein
VDVDSAGVSAGGAGTWCVDADGMIGDGDDNDGNDDGDDGGGGGVTVDGAGGGGATVDGAGGGGWIDMAVRDRCDSFVVSLLTRLSFRHMLQMRTWHTPTDGNFTAVT